ncbi:MAG: DMT family protein [Ferruginibacter sp.]
MFRTIILLTVSNLFMTFAWYGNLKNTSLPFWKLILISWEIAFFEYCFMVPANKLGFANGFSGSQLKMTQELKSLGVFSLFALFYLKEPFHWKYLVSFTFLLGAVYFMFKK